MAKEENIHVSAEDVLNAISMALNPATSTSTPSSAAGVARPMERPSSSGMNIEDTLTDDFLATLRLDAFAPRNVRLTRMFVILDDDFKTMKVPVGNKRKQINKADRQKAVTFWRNFTALQLNRKYMRAFGSRKLWELGQRIRYAMFTFVNFIKSRDFLE